MLFAEYTYVNYFNLVDFFCKAFSWNQILRWNILISFTIPEKYLYREI